MTNEWDKFKEWEATVPSRFDPAKSTPGSDYNEHHSIVEATAEEIGELLSRPGFVPVKDWVRRTPTPEDIEQGTVVAEELKKLRAKDVVIRAALAGYVSELRCRMTFCFCPHGEESFDRTAARLGPWMPTHEHYPTAARKKGTHRLDNVVLAHRRCNNLGHKLEELYEQLENRGLDPRAIQIAMDDHIALRRTRDGVFPRKRGAWKRALRVAQDAHDDLRAKGED